jgi:hypothetical protein
MVCTRIFSIFLRGAVVMGNHKKAPIDFSSISRNLKKLNFARTANSLVGVEGITKIYVLLNAINSQNPYICNLGVELGIY